MCYLRAGASWDSGLHDPGTLLNLLSDCLRRIGAFSNRKGQRLGNPASALQKRRKGITFRLLMAMAMALTLSIIAEGAKGQNTSKPEVAKKEVDVPGQMQTVFKGDSLSMTLKNANLEKVPIKVISAKDNGQVLKAKPGESFMLILPNPGAGGYVVRDPEFDPQILTLQKMETKPPSDPGKEGDFGSLEWTFQTKKEGISALIVRAFRPWERDKAPVVIFEASVVIAQ